MDQWTPQRRVLSTYGSAFRRRRSFHRVGLGIAATIVATGLAFIGAAVIRLELLEFLRADILNRSRIDLRPSRGDRHLGLRCGSGNRVVQPFMSRRMVASA